MKEVVIYETNVGGWEYKKWRGLRNKLKDILSGGKEGQELLWANKQILGARTRVMVEHHSAEVFAVCASFKTDDPPLWSALLVPSARAAALRENQGPLPKLPRRHALFPKLQTPLY